MSLGNRVRGGSVIIGDTDSMGIGFVEGVDDLRDEVHENFAGRAHRHSRLNVLFGERGERY